MVGRRASITMVGGVSQGMSLIAVAVAVAMSVAWVERSVAVRIRAVDAILVAITAAAVAVTVAIAVRRLMDICRGRDVACGVVMVMLLLGGNV